ncbi:DUF2062 domain-containing protein [Fontivita pretiosa]|uniref:DUF2062 domain-containing protein n=1 Tax=Fontivita pretiosa TaxID=2989684 RepID=UPI003D162D14
MPEDLRPTAYRPVVVAPTYDNIRSLPQVLEQLDRLGLDVIVVNDGSRDGTDKALAAWQDQATTTRRFVITHPTNRGKAAALKSGFHQAVAMGYTHAVTIDTDGQHDPRDVPRLLAASRRRPDSLVLGVRDIRADGYPRLNRLGRRISNLLVCWQSGSRIQDSQCGLRVYPLSLIGQLKLRWGRYGLETEVLARAAWAGVPIRQVPVRCLYRLPLGRVTHFRPCRDSCAAAAMHAMLLGRSLLPWPARRLGRWPTGTMWWRLGRWLSPWRAWRAVRQSAAQRRRFAVGLATGVFIANLPLYGLQTAAALIAARRLRLNPLAVVVGSHLSTPPVGPLLIASAIAVGHVMLRGSLPWPQSFDPRLLGYGTLLRNLLVEWAVGGVIVGAALGMLTFAVARTVIALIERGRAAACRPADPAVHPASPAQALDP